MRGDGSLYQRETGVWWYSYYRDGKHERESLKTKNPNVAERRAKVIRDGLLEGSVFAASERRVTVDELLDDLIADLKAKQRAWLPKATYFINRLREHFGKLAAPRLETSAVRTFQTHCREVDGLASATIDRHCELLRQAYKLGFESTPQKVTKRPMIPLIRENNARQGFVAAAEFWRILQGIEDTDLRDYLEWFWWTGMRPLEISRLVWRMFDRETWTLNLAPKAAKTRQPRLIPLRGPNREPTPVLKIMERRIQSRRLDIDLIFHRGGDPVKYYMDAWASACKAAGLKSGRKVEGGLTPYDLRRSALRNIVRGGTDYTVAMKISGHKTRSTFDRYNITSDEDVSAAMVRSHEYVTALPGGSWAKLKAPRKAAKRGRAK